MDLRVPVSDEIARWVLSWTLGCEVIEPTALREKVASKLEESLASYQDKRIMARAKSTKTRHATRKAKATHGKARKKTGKKATRRVRRREKRSKKKM